MRGSPVFLALGVFCILLLFSPVIWKLTQRDVAVQEVLPAEKKETAEIEITFSHPAKHISISHLGEEVWQKAFPGMEESVSLEIPWPQEGVELVADIEWNSDEITGAARFQVTTSQGKEYDSTVWGSAKFQEVLLFP